MKEADNNQLHFGEFPPIPTETWEALIINDLKGADYEKKLIWKTYDGLAFKPYYRAEDLNGLTHLGGLPGRYPYVRGNKTTFNDWLIRQDVSESTPEKAGKILAGICKGGVEAPGVCTSGMSTYDDFVALVSGIGLDKHFVHFTAPVDISLVTSFLIRYCEEHAIDNRELKGAFAFDPVGQWILRGGLSPDWDREFRHLADLVLKVRGVLPGFKVLSVNAQYFHNAGSSLVQEMAYGLAVGNEYLAGLSAQGLKPEEIAGLLHFTCATASDYFPEIAKIRALRLLWSRIVEQYVAAESLIPGMFIHSCSGTWNKTVYDPYVNMLRTTTEVMSAAIAGADEISVLPFDAAYAVPNEFSLRLARNQQIILREEAYLGKIIDPAAGSYYIEKLTDNLASAAWDLFRDTEAAGGFLAAFGRNSIQESIEKCRTRRKADVAGRKTFILGTNQFPNALEEMREQISIQTQASAMPGGVKALVQSRASEDIENLRLVTEAAVASGKKKPLVFLYTTGNLAMRKARAVFSSNFFGCAGYEVLDNPGFVQIEEGVKACLDAGTDILVICSSDEEYPLIVPEICQKLRERGFGGIIVLAGSPGERAEELKSAGIQHFIHLRSNLLESLTLFHRLTGLTD
ncbi:MAG TPA: methylmalonyl-CoA mutase family protein [Bacteroidales bacterium]|nr:methylmalonyl-CoA mutase family protein [Bacteroidales bacterium]HSA43921.1 methylmalonyl-CoA mutase family protein [Bacteroidales bacterium]